jgi:hypothetical protein
MTNGHRRASQGFALIAALLILFLLSVMSAGMIYVANSDTRSHTSDLESTQAYYANEAAMERMIRDLSTLYLRNQSPTVSQIQALGTARPVLPGFTFPEYQFIVPSSGGNPITTTRTISSGANQGLIAQIVPITLAATVRYRSGAEVRMTRDIEVALIPVFQFGMFSETDLSYFPGSDFTFAGRVHTNGNLFLAADDPVKVVFRSKVSAAGEIIRAVQSNGVVTTTTAQNGPILIPTVSAGCDSLVVSATCRDLQDNEGSRVAGPTSSINPNWNTLSTNTYNNWVVSATTGAKPLTLPFVNSELRPIQIIRRPPSGEDSSSAVAKARLYNLAQIRILLSDNPAELPGGAGDSGNIQLANTGIFASGVAVPGASNTYFAEGSHYATDDGGCTTVDTDWVAPFTPSATGCTTWPLIDGYLRVEARQSNGNYAAVTREFLELGFARGLAAPNSETGISNTVHPDAILILQQLADRNGDGDLSDGASSSGNNPYYVAESSSVTGSATVHNWYPISLYDTREGEMRPGGTNGSCAIGGIMNVVELDVRNLRRWLTGAIGSTGVNTESATQNGYVLYFSDRRGMLLNSSGQRVGEYGFEDVVNPADSVGNPDGVLQPAEDVNQNGVLDVYGRANLGDGFNLAAQGGDNANDNPKTRIDGRIARKNRVSGARHALKLINGSLGNLPTKPDNSGGFTVASENPVYVKGNYNANNSGFGDPHAAAAVIADAVMTLSNSWDDLNSFVNTTSLPSSGSYLRSASHTWHRLAIAAGKNMSFPQPAWDTTTDVGTDGGTHNFLRYLERWSGQTHYYLGSLVSLYYSEYNLGAHIPGVGAYGPPTRNYSFDTDFLVPAKLPPGTPRFTDLVNLGFQQVFTP